MSVWSHLKSLFIGNECGFLTHNGKPLTWARSSFLLPVVLSPLAESQYGEEIYSGLDGYNRLVGTRLFLHPASDYVEMWRSMQDPIARKTFLDIVYIDTTPIAALGPDSHGATHLNFDRRTGYIRSAYVVLPERPAVCNLSDALIRTIVNHELGHALGLAHDVSPHSLMYHKASERRSVHLTRADAALLRRTYGR